MLSSSFRSSLPWLALYVLLAFVILLPMSLAPASRLPDDGDAVLGLWIVWWSATHLSKGYPGIFDANAFYPHPSGLLYSEPMLGQGLLSWPLFGALDDKVLAMNLLTLLTLGLSAFASHCLYREITGSTPGALTGAIFFTFNAYSLSQLPRIQLITLQWMALALLCLHRYVANGRKAYLVGFALFSILQGLSCFYYLLFFLVALGILIPTYFWAFRRFGDVRRMGWLAVSGLFVGAALTLVALPYLKLYAHYGFTSVPESYDLAGYFQPQPQNLLYGRWGVRGVLVDHFLGYIGLAIGALGATAFLRERAADATRKIALGYLVVGALAFFLSAGPELRVFGHELGNGPFALLSETAPFRNMRTPDRFSVLVTLALGLLIARGAAAIHGLMRARWIPLTTVLLTGLVLSEHWTSRRTRGREVPRAADVPEVYRWLAAREGEGAVAELPVRPFREIRFVTMDAYFSTFHGRNILFNKPSFYPPAMGLLQSELRSFPSPSALTLLQAIGVPLLVVHPSRWGEGMRGRAGLRAIERRLPDLALLRAFPERSDPLSVKFQLGGERVYSIPPLLSEGEPRPCACVEIPRSSFTVSANGANNPALAVDGDRGTKWTTGVSQRRGHFFEVAFDAPRRPVRLEIDMVYPYGEFPRDLEVNGHLDQHVRRMELVEDVWYTVALVRQLVADPAKARFRVDLAPEAVDRLRLFIGKTEGGAEPWSIAELHLYETKEESR